MRASDPPPPENPPSAPSPALIDGARGTALARGVGSGLDPCLRAEVAALARAIHGRRAG